MTCRVLPGGVGPADYGLSIAGVKDALRNLLDGAEPVAVRIID
ncbi:MULTISPECIES: hypothetical protein [Streptomyces]|nr:hypothetical protein [Streptomyces lasalocidi]